MTCAYFVSDLHLRSSEEPNAQIFLAFLERLHRDACGGDRNSDGDNDSDSSHAQGKPTHLFLVGDIFDLWIGDHEFFARRFAPIVSAIRRLVGIGISVHYFEGNHDLHLKSFWQKRVGASVHPDAAYFELAGKSVRVEHGDLINPNDKGYLFLRFLLRSAPLKALALNLPAAIVSAIGDRASRVSRGHTSNAKGLPQDEIRRLIRRHAEASFIEKPYDLLISGHVHVADDHIFMSASGRQVRSVNLGSWYEPPRAFVLSDMFVGFVPFVVG